MTEKPTFTQRLNLPYLMGVYAAVNGLRDAYLLVDGPQCVSFKAEHLSAKHDWRSTLLDPSGFHRIVMTGTTFDSVAFDREDTVVRLLGRIAERPEAGVVMVSCLTMCGLTGIQYERLIRPLAARTGKPFLEVRADSLEEDWLDGYAAVWEALARTADVRPIRKRKDAVVLVGHLMDRNEADGPANIAELSRMLAGAGLELVSSWPSGGSYGDLSRAGAASAVVCLPYARSTGKALARRLKVPIIETGLPFGLKASADWLRSVARPMGRVKEAERFIDAELKALLPGLEFAVPQVFLNRRLLYAGDPHLLEGFLGMAETLGFNVTAAATSRTGRLGPLGAALAPAALEEPEEAVWLSEARARGPFDLCVLSHPAWAVLGGEAGPVMEFGFPSHFHHALAPAPFLGLRGFFHFADRMAEHLMAGRMRAVERRSSAGA
ncbi:MAG: nitrogenase component 1 [Elusimicrobiota bacterium]|jgi:nitrogenase molybdenum-iron protein alpha/beta subunit